MEIGGEDLLFLPVLGLLGAVLVVEVRLRCFPFGWLCEQGGSRRDARWDREALFLGLLGSPTVVVEFGVGVGATAAVGVGVSDGGGAQGVPTAFWVLVNHASSCVSKSVVVVVVPLSDESNLLAECWDGLAGKMPAATPRVPSVVN